MRTARRLVLGFMYVVMGAAPAARAREAQDLTGSYSKEGGTLVLLQGQNETLVHYSSSFPQGGSYGTCECDFPVKKKSATVWASVGGDPEFHGSVSLGPDSLTVQVPNQRCCGLNGPGENTFQLKTRSPLDVCTVKADRAYFHDLDRANTPRKTYVVAGDKVDFYFTDIGPDLAFARFTGAHDKATVGMLDREQLECAKPEAQAAAPGVKAEQLQPLAGTWWELTKKDKGYVISKPCASDLRSITLTPASARLEVQFGQESESETVTKLTPGATAGAYTLELTRQGGSPEQVEWTVTDADKGLVSLSSPDLFAAHPVYVREDKKAAYPLQPEKGCGKLK